MSFYYLKEEMVLVLQNILDNIYDQEKFLIENIGITWINYPPATQNIKGFGCGINQQKELYPASIIKLIYGLAVYHWIGKKQLIYDHQIDNAVEQMLSKSSNDATSFIIDILTGTTSGPSIEGESWAHWKYQRQIINHWLKEFKWSELDRFNCCQKTWEDGPFGREKDFYGMNNWNKNLMSTNGTARILEEIMMHIKYEANNINLKKYLSRKLKKDLINNDQNNQINGFLGEGIPEGTPFWSKAGLMSLVRHDAAWWINNDYSQTLLVVFCDGKEFSQSETFLPNLSREIFAANKDFIKKGL